MKKCGILVIAAVIFKLALAVPASATEPGGDEVLYLGEIVVTATRTETEAANAPSSVVVLTAEDLKKYNIKTVDEAIRLITGVFDRRTKGIMDIMPKLTIRGLHGETRNLVLLDGQRIVDWRRTPLDLSVVERIEVVKGPLSTLYGEGAMGGVVNIITKEPEEGFKGSLNTGYESHNTKTFQLSGSGKDGDFSYRLSYQKRETDGYVSNFYVSSATATGTVATVTGWTKTKDKYGNTRYLIGDKGRNEHDDEAYNLRFGWNLSDSGNINFNYIHTDFNYGYVGGQSYLRSIADGSAVNSGTVYIDDGGIKRISVTSTEFGSDYGGCPTDLFNLSYNRKFKGWNLKLDTGVGKEKYNWAYPSSIPYVMETPQKDRQLELQANIFASENHILTVGTDYRTNKVDSQKWQLSNWLNTDSRTTLSTRVNGRSKIHAFYLQDEIILGDTLTIYIGGRYDDWRTSDGYSTYLRAGSYLSENYPSRSQKAFSSKTALVYHPSDRYTLRFSAGNAFNTPTSYELYKKFFYTSYAVLGNPNLEPEKVRAYDLGVNYELAENTSLTLTYFDNRMTEYIYSRQLTGSEVEALNAKYGTTYATGTVHSSMSMKDNIGKAKSEGFELSINQRLAKHISLPVNYTYTKARVLANPGEPLTIGKRLPDVPTRSFNIGMIYDRAPLSASLTYRHVGKRYSEDDNSDVAEGYFGCHDKFSVVDLKISYKIKDDILLSVTGDNIFDEEYYQYYKSPGSTWGIHLNYDF